MEAFEHTPGQRDFLIEEKDVSVTEFRRKPSAVWRYLETPGHVIFFTRRKKHIAVLMSIETHACLSNDYEAEIPDRRCHIGDRDGDRRDSGIVRGITGTAGGLAVVDHQCLIARCKVSSHLAEQAGIRGCVQRVRRGVIVELACQGAQRRTDQI